MTDTVTHESKQKYVVSNHPDWHCLYCNGESSSSDGVGMLYNDLVNGVGGVHSSGSTSTGAVDTDLEAMRKMLYESNERKEILRLTREQQNADSAADDIMRQVGDALMLRGSLQ